LTYQLPDGRLIFALGNAVPLFDKTGQTRGAVGAYLDITERKRAEARLAERHATLNAILESSATPVFSLDRDYCYTSFNQAHAAVMKALYGAEIEIGKNMLAYQTVPADREVARKNLDRALGGESIIESAYSGEAEGTRRYYEVAHNPIRELSGEIIGVSIFVSDITERKLAQEALQEYSARLEADVTERTRQLTEAQERLVRQEKLAVMGQLAGSVAHELRNPLGVISNATYYLRMILPQAEAQVLEYLSLIEGEIRVSEKIINNLLGRSRIQTPNRRPVTPTHLVQAALRRYPLSANVQLSLNLPDDLPPIHVDADQITQVLGNLLTNACQAMPNGGSVTLSARQEGQFVALTVTDTGTGISPEHRVRLFEPLFTTKLKGIGLGLSLSKSLVEANDGQIAVISEVGRGSSFTIHLPVASWRAE
jgi:PAS domain S-box-containing protein